LFCSFFNPGFNHESSEMYPRGNFECHLCDVGQNLALTGWNRVKVSENLGAMTVIFAH
jgi:hypothetical protein